MPRKPRIEFPGAVYPVLNRGNYRQDLYTLEGAGASFEQTLFEACDRYGWQLYAYVLMSNHFHLCLKSKATGDRQERAEQLLEKGLGRLGRSSRDLQADLKLAEWKVVLAAWIRLHCGVSNRWFSESMHMGSLYGVSKAGTKELARKGQGKPWRALGTPEPQA